MNKRRRKRTCHLTAVTRRVSPPCHIRIVAAHPDRMSLLIAEQAPSRQPHIDV